MSAQEIPRRFKGAANVYGNDGYLAFTRSHVTIIGVGGVGSWTVEGLVRNGIGYFCLIDEDVVAESNINRQLAALDSSCGKNKIDVLKDRTMDINPEAQVDCVDEFLTEDNIAELIPANTDFVIDCIDNSRIKAALIAWCKRNKIKILTIGGAGGQFQPELIRVGDLTRVIQDPLLSKTRKLLRQNYAFTSTPKRRFSIPAVYSKEIQQSAKSETGETLGALTCAGGLGSAVVVTSCFGMHAAAYVLNKLSKKI